MVLFETLLARPIWKHPLEAMVGNWTIYNKSGFQVETVENILLFIPYTILLFWCCRRKIFRSGITFRKIITYSVSISFVFSTGIEICQALFHLGILQLSDIFFNIIGGVIGGVIYLVICICKNKWG